jgi:hypothetical protein
MNYKILKEIIMMLRQKLKCPGCNKIVSGKDIYIEALMPNATLVRFDCKECGTGSLIEVILMNAETANEVYNGEREHRPIQIKTKTLQTVSENDVLDIKNFLKNFKGDFRTIFKN